MRFLKRVWLNRRAVVSSESPPVPSAFYTECGNQYRIANDAAEGYLLYIGVNGMPDFTKDADAFSATLPIEVSWPLPGNSNQFLYVVARKRNKYGCVSQNVNPTVIWLTPTGVRLPPLPNPQAVIASPMPDASINVVGQYPEYDIVSSPADKVRVWVSSTGLPNVNGAYTYQGNVTSSLFGVNFGTYTPGTYYIAVALFRSSDSAVSGPVFTTVTFPPVPSKPEPVFTDKVTI